VKYAHFAKRMPFLSLLSNVKKAKKVSDFSFRVYARTYLYCIFVGQIDEIK